MEYSKRSHTLVAFFLLFILIGGAHVGIGLWLHFYIVEGSNLLMSFFEADSFHKELYGKIAFARIALGSAAIFSTMCSMLCCTRMHHKGHVSFFTSFVIFLICAEIGGIVVPVLLNESSVDAKETEFIKNITTLYGDNSQEAISASATIDSIQRNYECCGAGGPKDYIDANKVVPSSCCPSAGCATEIYQQGCLYPAFEKPTMNELSTMIYIAMCFVGVEIVALILSFCLCGKETVEGKKDGENSSQKTLRSSYKGSHLDAYGQTGKVNSTMIVYNIPAPNDPLFYQDHMNKYQSRASALNYNEVDSNLSSGSTAVFQAQKLPVTQPQRRAEMSGFDASDPSNDVLYYHNHMKRFPPPNRMSCGEEQAAMVSFD